MRNYSFVDFSVSIHAPTKGATYTLHWVSTHRLLFQSTHPRRVRPRSARRSASRGSFNPRTHEGCDSVQRTDATSHIVSIHAPTKGATIEDLASLQMFIVSIHAPTKGATPLNWYLDALAKFQSTHPRRVRRSAGRGHWPPWRFQSTHPRRVRPKVERLPVS